MRVHPRQQLVGVKGLGHIVHRAEFETAHDVAGLGFGGQEDDRNVSPVRCVLDAAAGLEPVHLRHHDVQQDQVRSHRRQHVQRLAAVGGDADRVAFFPQDGGEGLDVGGGILHDQDAAVGG
jgi:hypothetical protein